MIIKYPCTITKEQLENETRYLVSFIDFEETLTEGETTDEALFNAEEALTLSIESRFDEKIEIPFPSKGDHEYFISPSAQVQSALLVRFLRGKKTLSDLARTLHTSWPAASKLENPRHWPNLKQLDKTAHALGKRLIISME